MKEIGGYLELDKYNKLMRFDAGYKLNCGRNALAYLLIKKNIKKILMPKFLRVRFVSLREDPVLVKPPFLILLEPWINQPPVMY